jgi:BASS family bile acid:Na+ symporter
MLSRVTRLFPRWAVLISLAAYFSPETFTPVTPHVTALLTIIMFAMGVTLSFADFRRVFTRPAPVIAGVGLHYLVMPLAAWAIAKLLRVPPDLTAGMVLVDSVASGTASNNRRRRRGHAQEHRVRRGAGRARRGAAQRHRAARRLLGRAAAWL